MTGRDLLLTGAKVRNREDLNATWYWLIDGMVQNSNNQNPFSFNNNPVFLSANADYFISDYSHITLQQIKEFISE